jgi:hypothetical protein
MSKSELIKIKRSEKKNTFIDMHAIPPPLLYGSGSKSFKVDLRLIATPFAVAFYVIKNLLKKIYP